MSVASGAPMASSSSTSLGSPLVQGSHGTSTNTCIGASTGSSRIGVGTGTPGSVGRPSGSPDLGAGDEVPYRGASLGKRRPKWL